MIKDFIKNYQRIHFIGIGGRGLSALAQMLHSNGAIISGSDLSTDNNIQLLPADIQIFTPQSAKNIIQTKPDIVIHSYAILDDNPELKEAKQQGIPTLTYPEAVGEITKGYKLISVAGSHGKTTTTGILIHIFQELGIPFNALIGTTTKLLNNSNFHFDQKAEYFLLESCEYRHAFLNYEPHSAIITNIEIDHFDFYKTDSQYLEAFQKFVHKIQNNLILNTDYTPALKLEISKNLKTIKYSERDAHEVKLQSPGLHNQTNALAALQLCLQLGFNKDDTTKAIHNFPGVDRRQELVKETSTQKFYDDNAHTPTEIQATLQAFREKYPTEKICLIWQPQGYIRILNQTQDFIESVQSADKIILTNILNSRDTQDVIDQMPAEKFAELLNQKYQNTTLTGSIEATKENLHELTKGFPIVILIGGHHDVRRVLQ